MKRRRVVIVGGGFSGVAVAAQLARRGRTGPHVTIVERGARVGPGLAYSTKDPAHLLNVRAANLSAFPDQPDHFAAWLQRHKRGFGPASFAQRATYGRYIEDVLRRAPKIFGPPTSLVRGEVAACRPEEKGWIVSLADGREIKADAVVLALGNLPPTEPAIFRNAETPLTSPWDARAFARLPRGDVLLLGTGLTAVDVALSLARMRRAGVIYALSRRGQLPRVHLKNGAAPAPHAFELPAPLSEALFALRKEAEAAAARGEPWQHVVDRLRARTPELWQRLSLEAQQRFLRHVRPWWDAHRHRMAPEIAERLADLQREGRLRVFAGELASLERAGSAIHIQYRQRGSRALHRLEVTGIVNCTGASMDMQATANPLLQQLLQAGLIRPHQTGLGVEVDSEGRVLSASGSPQASLYALGPITQGVFWESTAVPEIRVRAAAIAAVLSSD